MTDPTPDVVPAAHGGRDRAQLARDALFWGAVADEARARAGHARHELESEALAELARDGVAPTWRIPGVGTVPLSLTTDTVVVTDETAYIAYMKRRHPTEVETVERVRPAYDEIFRKALARLGDPLCDDQGERIPGLEFRPGGQPRGVAIRPSTDAKTSAAASAAVFLDAQHAGGPTNGTKEMTTNG